MTEGQPHAARTSTSVHPPSESRASLEIQNRIWGVGRRDFVIITVVYLLHGTDHAVYISHALQMQSVVSCDRAPRAAARPRPFRLCAQM